MARLIGYMANRADRLRDALHQERHAIAGLPADHRGAWGIGFYQGDEILHKKQPTPDGEPVDWTAVAQNVKTDCAIAHVRQATVGGFSVDNTHPFRFRQWMFAHVGTIARFDEVHAKLRADLPDFLRRNIRGSSDSELFFHVILAGLHGKNQLEAANPAQTAVLESIHEAVTTIDAVVGGEKRSTLDMVFANGRVMYALRHGGPLGYVERSGVKEPISHEDDRVRPGSPLLRYVMIVGGGSGVPSDYAAVDDGKIVSINRDLEVIQHDA
jgi:predicted glutamine amidotransferase